MEPSPTVLLTGAVARVVIPPSPASYASGECIEYWNLRLLLLLDPHFKEARDHFSSLPKVRQEHEYQCG